MEACADTAWVEQRHSGAARQRRKLSGACSHELLRVYGGVYGTKHCDRCGGIDGGRFAAEAGPSFCAGRRPVSVLWDIAKRHGSSEEAIRRCNHMGGRFSAGGDARPFPCCGHKKSARCDPSGAFRCRYCWGETGEELAGALFLGVGDDLLGVALLHDDAAVHKDHAVGHISGNQLISWVTMTMVMCSLGQAGG